MYIYMYTYAFTCTYTNTHACIYARIHAPKHTYTHKSHMRLNMCKHAQIYKNLNIEYHQKNISIKA